MSNALIPVYEPQLDDADIEAVADSLRAGSISGSAEPVGRFERGWADSCDRQFGVAVSSGTTALQLAISALGLEPGDEVLVPSFTIISCALAAISNGLRPVFVDCDRETLCIELDHAESLIGPRTRAVLAVHAFGHPVDAVRLRSLASSHDLPIIEDAAEAHGSLFLDGSDWRPCGSYGAASTFSFYANKAVTSGEGGMVLTDDESLADKAKRLRNLAFGSGDDRYVHRELGSNFRMSSLQAALGCSQLMRLEEKVAAKRSLATRYADRFRGSVDVQLPVERSWARSAQWMYWIMLKESSRFDGRELRGRLAQRGIETRPFFTGLHDQPILREMGFASAGEFPETERATRFGVILPSTPTLPDGDLDRIVEAVSREVE